MLEMKKQKVDLIGFFWAVVPGHKDLMRCHWPNLSNRSVRQKSRIGGRNEEKDPEIETIRMPSWGKCEQVLLICTPGTGMCLGNHYLRFQSVKNVLTPDEMSDPALIYPGQ